MTTKVAAKPKGKRGKGKAVKAKRIELTTRQRDYLREDTSSDLTRQEIGVNGKKVTPTPELFSDLHRLASRDGDTVRQRVYSGLLARAKSEFGRGRKPKAIRQVAEAEAPAEVQPEFEN